MGEDDKKGSPRARARAHLQAMLRTASLIAVAGCGDDGSTGSSDPCAPDGCDPLPPPTTSETGNDTDTDSATSSTGADSTTWEDPCAEDGCDPPPPPGTSTGMSSSGTDGDSTSGTDSGTTGGSSSGG